jgi:hypothetical protein
MTTDPVSKMYFLVLRIPEDGKSPGTPVIPTGGLIPHHKVA